jgi:hypothetical protein
MVGRGLAVHAAGMAPVEVPANFRFVLAHIVGLECDPFALESPRGVLEVYGNWKILISFRFVTG